MNTNQKANVITECRQAASAFISASNLFGGASSAWKYTVADVAEEDFATGANAGLTAQQITTAFKALEKAMASLSDEDKKAIHSIRA